ncbi:MAG: YjbQ family protein [Thermoplasmata archaeon]|nr:YjbQ family protein [Thermoplasmata archaeon]
MREIEIMTKKRSEFIDITDKVQQVVNEEKLIDGYVIVFVPHTTAGITINEGADPSVRIDIERILSKIAPEDSNYQHMEGNSDAHIKASLLGSSVTVLVKNGKLLLGTWQSIYLYEGDGPRRRKIYVECVSTER